MSQSKVAQTSFNSTNGHTFERMLKTSLSLVFFFCKVTCCERGTGSSFSPSLSLFGFSSFFFGMTATFIDFPDQQKENAPQLEPALEGLLRPRNPHEGVTMAFRCNHVLTRSVSVALDSSEEGHTKTAKAFDINVETEQFVHMREMAKLISAWQQGKVEHETKREVDAICRARGEPVSMLLEDYESLLTSFKKVHGKFHDAKLPTQSCFEAFQDKLQEGRLKPET